MDLLNAEIRTKHNEHGLYEIICMDKDSTEILHTCPEGYGVTEAGKITQATSATLNLIKLMLRQQTPPVQVNKEPFKKGDLVQLIKAEKEPRLLEVVFKIREIGRIEYSGVLMPSYRIAGYFNGRTITLRRISNELKFYVKSEEGK